LPPIPSLDLKAFDALTLSLHHRPGVHALLVDSGLSRSAGIATGWGITVDLIRRLAALGRVLEYPDWATWCHDEYGKDPGYSQILDALSSSPSEWRSIQHGYIDPEAESDARRPTEAHRAIAAMVAQETIRVIITTNFDRLLENALRDGGAEPAVIASEDAIAGVTPLIHSRCAVIKVHGDYLDAQIKNTEAELADYASGMNALLKMMFDQFGLVVIGWSGEWDIALQVAIFHAPSRRYQLIGLLVDELYRWRMAIPRALLVWAQSYGAISAAVSSCIWCDRDAVLVPDGPRCSSMGNSS
jgi:hypothetical protein